MRPGIPKAICLAAVTLLAGGCAPDDTPNDALNAPDCADTAGPDTDADGVENSCDNCPATPNDQGDTNDDGVGDACAALSPAQVAFRAEDGVHEALFDDRSRLITFVGPGLAVHLAWSDDATHADLTAEHDGQTRLLALETDLSDSSLLDDIEDYQARAGMDLSILRDWLTDHPGWALAVTRGEGDPLPAAKSGTCLQPAATEEAQVYVSQLTVDAITVLGVITKLTQLADSILQTQPDAYDFIMFFLVADLQLVYEFMVELVEEQYRVCIESCTLACWVDCVGPGRGACCPTGGADFACFDSDAAACADAGGSLAEGFTCADQPCGEAWGACVVEVGAITTCSEQRAQDCAMLGGTSYPDTSCSVLPAPGGACTYTTFDGLTTCTDGPAELCDVLGGSFEAGVFCASGACRYDAGGVVLCVHNNVVDCLLNLGGEYDAGELCHGYSSARP